MSNTNSYIKAARLKTLPLAIAAPLMAISLALLNNTLNFSWLVALLCILVAISLQILSNFANDLGDFQKGTDTKAGRTDRMLSSGAISVKQMKWAIAYTSLISLILGICLLIIGIRTREEFLTLFVIGICAIIAAITYTVGKKAYGYHGLGDLFVFIFFGLVAVLGSYYLLTKTITLEAWIAACSMGFFSTLVLNINNTRDLVKDKENNKITLPVKLGFAGTRNYHIILAGLASLGVLRLLVVYNTPLIAIGLFLLIILLHKYLNLQQEEKDEYNLQLKFTSLTIALIAVLFFTHAIYQYYF